MIQDLSFIHEKTSEEQEEAIKQAIVNECYRSIATFLTEVADTMDANSIETLDVPSLRAMAAETFNRITENAQNQD